MYTKQHPTYSLVSCYRTAAIAIGVASGCAVGAIGLAMVIWLRRERRRQAARAEKNVEVAFADKPQPPPNPNETVNPVLRVKKRVAELVRKPSGSVRIIKDPPYTDVKFELVTPASFAKRPLQSVVLLDANMANNEPLSSIPVPIVTPLPPAEEPSNDSRIDPPPPQNERRPSIRPSSLSSADIEQILNTATIYSGSAAPSLIMPIVRPEADEIEPEPQTGRSTRTGVATHPPSTPGMLTPHSTTSYRDPPRAPMPSSPLPSPAAGSSFVGSRSSFDARSISESTRKASRGLSGFSFFRSPEERASVADSFLAM